MNDQEHTYRFFTCGSCGHTFSAPVSCKNRFCSICSGPRRRKIKAKLKAICSSLKPRPGYSVKFVTLTIPNCRSASDGFIQITRSFRRLRQRSWFRNRCKGGAWVIEITGEPGRWHVHLHALLESRYLAQPVLARHWARVSTGRIVHIKAIPVSAIINYVTTYLTKSDLPHQDQVQLSTQLKGSRLFQPFGSWHRIALLVPKVKYCCPVCDYEGFYLNNSGFRPEIYGADHPVGSLERSLRDRTLRKYPLPIAPFRGGVHHITPK